MAQFAKLIELPEGEQVLFIKEYNDEDEVFEISATTQVDDLRMSMNLGYDTAAQRDNVFNDISEENASQFIDSLVEMTL